MAVEVLNVSLRGWGGSEATGSLFFDLIGLQPESGYTSYSSDSPYKAARIVLVSVSLAECAPGPERHQEFATKVGVGLKHAADWLASLVPTRFDEWRARGMVADVFIGGWMNSDQFDLKLPPDFLLACGRLGLPIEICTND